MSTLPTSVRDDALNLSIDLAQAGVVFNDSTRLLDGGLWSTPADSNNQAAYLGLYSTDITAVSDDINAALGNPNGVTVSGDAYPLSAADTAVLTQVEGQLQTLLTEAPLSVGNSHNATTAQELIHTTQTSILSEINSDSALAAALATNPFPSGTGANNVGFENLPAGSDDSAALATAAAPNATLGQIGTVFNAAADLAVGGLNHANLPEFNADMKAIATGLTNLLGNPTALSAIESGEAGSDAALTTIHLQTVLNQVNLQINSFDAEYATNPNIAARSTNDNVLDIIDIVQNDTALNTAAGGNGNPGTVGGFAELPAYMSGTIARLLTFSHWKPENSWTFVHKNGKDKETVTFQAHFSMNDFTGLAPALVAGAGIGDLPPVVQPGLVRDGRLVEVMPDWRFRPYDLSLVQVGNRHVTKPCRLFKDLAVQMAPSLFPDLPA